MNRPLGRKNNPELRRLYEVEGYNLRQIAKHFGSSHQAVHDRLLRMGVTMRPRSLQRFSFEREDLYRLYIVECLTLTEIAIKLGVTTYFVRRELIRHAIPLRRPGQRKPRV